MAVQRRHIYDRLWSGKDPVTGPEGKGAQVQPWSPSCRLTTLRQEARQKDRAMSGVTSA